MFSPMHTQNLDQQSCGAPIILFHPLPKLEKEVSGHLFCLRPFILTLSSFLELSFPYHAIPHPKWTVQ